MKLRPWRWINLCGRRTVVWTQRNGTHSEVADKPHYPMITGATLNEWINMKIVTTRKDYREHWKFCILKEHVFHSPLEILLFNKESFTSTIYTGVVRLNFQKTILKNCKNKFVSIFNNIPSSPGIEYFFFFFWSNSSRLL